MIHWPTLLIAAALSFAFLQLVPTPKGCGCEARKQTLAGLFGA